MMMLTCFKAYDLRGPLPCPMITTKLSHNLVCS